MLNDTDELNDRLDCFNHPRLRRALILQELYNAGDLVFDFDTPSKRCQDLSAYASVCSERLLTFLSAAYDQWHALGQEGQDSMGILKGDSLQDDNDDSRSPPLIPGNVVLHREKIQRPSKNVLGQVGFFCTDLCTPIFKELKEELLWDSATMKLALEKLKTNRIVYALGTHPGHHAAKDSFGGYCYLNSAAILAREIQISQGRSRVAVLDVDYVSYRRVFKCLFMYVGRQNIHDRISQPLYAPFSTLETGQPRSSTTIQPF